MSNNHEAVPSKPVGSEKQAEIVLYVSPKDQPLYNALLEKSKGARGVIKPPEAEVLKKKLAVCKAPPSGLRIGGLKDDGIDFTGWKVRKLGEDVGKGCTKNCRKVLLCTLANDPSKLCPKHKVKHSMRSNFFTANPQPNDRSEYREAFKKWPPQVMRRNFKPSQSHVSPITDDEEMVYEEDDDNQYKCRPIKARNISEDHYTSHQEGIDKALQDKLARGPEYLDHKSPKCLEDEGPEIYPLIADEPGPCKGYPMDRKLEDRGPSYVLPCVKPPSEEQGSIMPEGPTVKSTYTKDYQPKPHFPTRSIKQDELERRSLLGKGTQELACQRLAEPRAAEFTRRQGRKLVGTSLYRTEYQPWPVHPPSIPRWAKERDSCRMTTCPHAPFDARSIYQENFKPFKELNPPKQILQKGGLSTEFKDPLAQIPPSTYTSDYRMFCIDAARVQPIRHKNKTEFPTCGKLDDISEYRKSFKGDPGKPSECKRPIRESEKYRPPMTTLTEYTMNFIPYDNSLNKKECPMCEELYCIPACICPPDDPDGRDGVGKKRSGDKIPLQSIRLPPMKVASDCEEGNKLEDCEVVLDQKPLYKIYC